METKLQALKRRLRGHWIKKTLQRGDKFCLVGMGGQVRWDWQDQRVLAETILEQYPERTHWPSSQAPRGPRDCREAQNIIVGFNDHMDTRKADVDLVLEKADIRRQEQIELIDLKLD